MNILLLFNRYGYKSRCYFLIGAAHSEEFRYSNWESWYKDCVWFLHLEKPSFSRKGIHSYASLPLILPFMAINI
jgi:hypothetical protein